VSGSDWHQLVAIDLASGRALWAQELGPVPVRAGGVSDGQVWIDQGAGPHAFGTITGEVRQVAGAAPDRSRSHLKSQRFVEMPSVTVPSQERYTFPRDARRSIGFRQRHVGRT